MKIIDMHCDTISELADRGGDFGKTAAIWILSGRADICCRISPCLWISEGTDTLGSVEHRMVPVLCYEDILKNEACGKLSALLTVEEGRSAGESLEGAHGGADAHWNYRNELGSPASVSGGRAGAT